MAERGQIIGEIPCPWCALIGRHGRMTVKVDKKLNLFAWCGGGLSGDLPSCGGSGKIMNKPRLHLVTEFHEAERASGTPAPPAAAEDDELNTPEHEDDDEVHTQSEAIEQRPGELGERRSGFSTIFDD